MRKVRLGSESEEVDALGMKEAYGEEYGVEKVYVRQKV